MIEYGPRGNKLTDDDYHQAERLIQWNKSWKETPQTNPDLFLISRYSNIPFQMLMSMSVGKIADEAKKLREYIEEFPPPAFSSFKVDSGEIESRFEILDL